MIKGKKPKLRQTEKKPAKPRMMVNIIAGPVAWVLTSATQQGIGAKIADSLFQGCELLHFWTGRLLIRTGQLLKRGLAYLPWSCRLGLLSTVLAVMAFQVGMKGWASFCEKAELKDSALNLLAETGLTSSSQWMLSILAILGMVLAPVCLLPFLRRSFVPLLLKVVGIAFALMWLMVAWLIMSVPGTLQTLGEKKVPALTKELRNVIWVEYGWFWVAVAVVVALFLLCLCLRSVREFYSGATVEQPLVGDRIVENILTNGRDPVYRTSLLWAAWLHIFVLFLIPLLLNLGGCTETYPRPEGEDSAPVQVVVKVKPKEKEKKFVLNLNSSIILYIPDIEKDSEVMEEVAQETQNIYVAGTGKKAAKTVGFGGKPGGVLRFIRLEYSGGDWEDGMGKGGDYNMLIEFNKLQKTPIAKETESRSIAQLKRFAAGSAPPFVFIKGTKGFQLTSDEVKILRNYCTQEGGMLFVDCGSRQFFNEVRRELGRVFQNPQWIDIANDDIIFQQPYQFPNGAPSVFSHAGNRASGIKSQDGRWVVFLHPGDLADLWRDGHAGASAEQTKRGFMMGVNIINYAFRNYMAIHDPQQ